MAYKLIQDWLPQNKYWQKASHVMTPKGIIVHNTAGDSSAKSERNTMVNANNSISYHVVIDEKEVIEIIPFNRNAWHAGDGPYGFANRNLIGIEIARSTSDKALYLQAEDNAVVYIAMVLKQYGWGIDKLYKHKQFTATACPHRTEELGWGRFIDKVKKELDRLNKPQEKPKPINKFQADIESLKAKGITSGERPNDPITRGEVFALINRTLNYLKKEGK